jgi:hypothetical protein
MEHIITLLGDYVEGKVSSATFVDQYMKAWKELRDEVSERIESIPGLPEQIAELSKRRLDKRISGEDFKRQHQKLVAQIGETRLKPFSEVDAILSHLFVESDAYREDPEDREPGFNIGEDELVAEAKTALVKLTELGL